MRLEPGRRPSLRSLVAVTVPALLAGAALPGGGGLAHAAPAGQEARIAVLVSQDAAPYQEALQGFRRSLEQQGIRATVDVYPLHGDGANAAPALQRARQDHARLLLTLGSLGTQAAVREAPGLPVVAGLILNQDDLGKAANATGVVLEFPVETEFRWLQRLLPKEHNVGVLFNPAENQGRVDAATRVARTIGLTLQARKVESPRDLPDALESLANRADVLWGLADQVVLTPQTVKPILLFSIRNRIPFIGLSLTWVKAGALYALDRDYGDIGAQCGELAAKVLQGSAPAALPPVPPRKVIYAINMKTAKLLKLDIQEGVLQGAQSVIE
ncbi:MAG TPA: ABC transporter substrate binding protein [Candidatus Polarisedimenticolia bacterium]|nr:ABC transporter substrate binding protein [Candidatus Polarisedimenticolia bacterium]